MALIKLNNQSLSAVTSAGLPSGSVLQVVQFFDVGVNGAAKSPLASLTNADGYTDIMSKAIITEAANSKILVQIKTVGYDAANSTVRGATKTFRDSTLIDGDSYSFYEDTNVMVLFNSTILDAPAAAAGTTITYKLQAAQGHASGALVVGYGDSGGGGSSQITLTEIAG
tara:strand:- start:392 stop:898 length:507 start_codon:yes stop_codon:yes gene_type:complete